MNKTLGTILATGTLLVVGTTVDMVQKDAPLSYSYQYEVRSYVPLQTIHTATGTMQTGMENPEYHDDDGNGLISVKVGYDKFGNKRYEQIDDHVYDSYTKKDGKYLLAPVSYSVTLAEALIEETASLAEAAIARDTSFYLNFTGTSGSTASKTVTGSNLILICFANNQTGANNFTSATMNGAALTNAGVTVQEGSTGRYTNLWYLVAPTSGVLTFNRSTSNDSWIVCDTYNGAAQTAPEVTTTANFSSTVLTTTLTTLTDNAWTVLHGLGSRTFTAGTGSTFILNNTAGGFAIFDSNGPVTPAGSHSMTVTQSDTTPAGTIMISIAPFIESAASILPCKGDLYGDWYCSN